MLKTEREQSRKMMHNMNHEVRQITEKLSRQSGAMGTGLQELKAHLDQKDTDNSHAVGIKSRWYFISTLSNCK